jgi:hypothetical protein
MLQARGEHSPPAAMTTAVHDSYDMRHVQLSWQKRPWACHKLLSAGYMLAAAPGLGIAS